MEIDPDVFFMREALKEAVKAREKDEVPIGSVLVINKRIITRSHNQVEELNDATAHAEMIAITGASAALTAKYLPKATLYVTLEPCLMCAGAIWWSQVRRVVFGAYDLKKGYTTVDEDILSGREIKGGVLAKECGVLLTDFFRKKREQS